MRAMWFARLVIVMLAASLASGCQSPQDRALRHSPSFREGYEDGCAAASTESANYRENLAHNNPLYDSDKAYHAGWTNGFQACRPQPQNVGQANPGIPH